MIINAYELNGQSRCNFKRDKNLLLKQAETTVYEKARVIKTVIKDYLKVKSSRRLAKADKDDIEKRLTETFADLDYSTPETAKQHAKDAKRQVVRYVWSETRVPVAYYPKAQMINLSSDLQVKVSPDLIFCQGDMIEVVKLRISKPTVTQNGRQRDKSAEKSLELYALLKYAEQFVKPGHKCVVKASFYFLRRNDDRNDNSTDWEFQDFFEPGGGNVVSLEEEFVAMDPNNRFCLYKNRAEVQEEYDCKNCLYPHMCHSIQLTDYDHCFEKQVQEFLDGDSREECDMEDCKTCTFFRSCQYKKSPIALEAEPVQKTIRSLKLTEAQKNAINFRKGICRINAGAGAGKTLVVALRIAYMLDEGVEPEKVLMLTFTNTGAEEMRQRVALYNDDLGNDADPEKLVCSTFNSFGDQLIKENYTDLGYTEEPRLIDDVEKGEIIRELLTDNLIDGLDYKNFESEMPSCVGALAVIKRCFAIIKAYDLSLGDEAILRQKGPSTFIKNQTAYEKIFELYAKYEDILMEQNLYDFADQEKKIFELVRKDPYFLDNLGFKHIIVDEFQDSNKGQLDLLKLLIDTKDFESLMVVGDDSQAIFGFRDCSPEYIINFFDILGEEGEDIYLVENHRCTPEIIDFANKINDMNVNKVAKSLIATRASVGKPVVCNGFHSKKEEYEWIVGQILEKTKAGTKPEDIAFIAATKDELMAMADLLTMAGIPSVLLNPEKYMENSKVLAALDLVKAIADVNATNEILTYLNGCEEGTLIEKPNQEIQEKIEAFQKSIQAFRVMPEPAKKAQLNEWLEALDSEDGDEVYESFVERLSYRKTIETVINYCKDFEKYGANEAIRRTRDYPGVVLTTAHSSKGLEWPVVYTSISKFHSKDIPSIDRVYANTEKLEEKRRLLFVTCTRARDELIITGQYIAFGGKKDATYNRFLKESMDVIGKEFTPVDPLEKEKKTKRKKATKDTEESAA